MKSTDFRRGARERFFRHRQAMDDNPAVARLYRQWFAAVAEALPPRALGPRAEVGAGPGFARRFIPDLLATDVVAAPWLDLMASAEWLPFAGRSLGAIVLFDVLHHLAAPSRFFDEASRVLRPGGRIVLCEPAVSPLSFPVYRWFHEEGLDFACDPFSADAGDRGDLSMRPEPRDPFAGNQAVPSMMLERQFHRFHERFAGLRIRRIERLAGPSYPLSGGLGRRPFVPMFLWSKLHALEGRLPAWIARRTAFRLLAVIERL